MLVDVQQIQLMSESSVVTANEFPFAFHTTSNPVSSLWNAIEWNGISRRLSVPVGHGLRSCGKPKKGKEARHPIKC